MYYTERNEGTKKRGRSGNEVRRLADIYELNMVCLLHANLYPHIETENTQCIGVLCKCCLLVGGIEKVAGQLGLSSVLS